MHFPSQFARVAVALGLLAGSTVPLPGQSDAEEELKCATLLAFVQNAHWKDASAVNAPIIVGVVGRKTFLQWVSAGIAGKVVEGHPLRAQEVTAPIDPGCCQVVYFASNKPEELAPALQALTSGHVLTIGETDRFLELGGAVNLFLVDGHMAFEVSLRALDRAGIEIGSRLLRYGQIRDPRKGGRK